MTDEQIRYISVRFPPDLRDKIAAEARRLNLSINAFIVKTMSERLSESDVNEAIREIKLRLKRLEETVFNE